MISANIYGSCKIYIVYLQIVTLILQIANLEKLLEVQDAKFNAAIQDLTAKLSSETEKRTALQAELQKLAQCVTQV